MTVVNRLIKEATAHPAPKEVVVTANHAREVASHCYRSTFPQPASIEAVLREMEKGGLKICGVPVRVVGLRRVIPFPAAP